MLMEPRDLLRHQIIQNVTAQHTEKAAVAAVNLWEQMATQIISLVGEGGFNSLYDRSVRLTQPTFPWLTANSQSALADHHFQGLNMRFEGQTTAQISAANCLLLITFTDILASLIGEELTISMLRLAWSNVASEWAGKEYKK